MRHQSVVSDKNLISGWVNSNDQRNKWMPSAVYGPTGIADRAAFWSRIQQI